MGLFNSDHGRPGSTPVRSIVAKPLQALSSWEIAGKLRSRLTDLRWI